ncbi:MAG: S-methyl-5-thioribose-1-phosphate isomerase [Candidatus Aceula meridiana]|nr:S-methyl-5-thioribose-1-phosphate isomerase [Candidatus Aceula meridiana]
MSIPTIQWVSGAVRIIDQRKLPNQLKFLTCKDTKALWSAIKTLAVRGAPALGAAAAFGVLLGIKRIKTQNRKVFDKELKKICNYIGSSRPTAVNLFNALSDMEDVALKNPSASVDALKKKFKVKAMGIFNHDKKVCRQMGANGAKLVKDGQTLMTICNAGALATVDYGTALGVFYSAKQKKKRFKVFACETRPLLQGARLTAWELQKQKIDVTLICDNMAATLMQQKKVDMIFTGADRIALNGDSANKIGTYNLAVLAKHHKVPFYVVAPLSTFDTKIKTGKSIPIERRDPNEVTTIAGKRTAPKNIKVYNPAFDVTPRNLITGIVTECGVVRAPNAKKIKRLFK